MLAATVSVMRNIAAVWFDVGETLVDETRAWGAWADPLGVPRLTFFALLGAVIARGGHHREVFAFFPADQVKAARARVGGADVLRPEDFYPDARPCLQELCTRGVRVGLCGNQPLAAEDALRSAGLSVDFIASSSAWGVEKPSPAFFERLAQESELPPERIAYVGDRLDNDVLPAARAGMTAILVRRGPWGYLHAGQPEACRAHAVIQGLGELPATLGLS